MTDSSDREQGNYSDSQLMDASYIAYVDFQNIAERADYLSDYTIGELVDLYNDSEVSIDGNFQFLPEIISSPNWDTIKDWRIVDFDDTNDTNGFYGSVIDTGGGNAIIAFRGSEDASGKSLKNDWIDADLGLINSTLTAQQAETERFLQQIAESSYIDRFDSLALTGHSLGCQVAEHATLMSTHYGLDTKVSLCAGFDGPGTSEEYRRVHAEEIAAMAGVITHYRFSPAGFLMGELPGATYITIKTKPFWESEYKWQDFFDPLYWITKHDMRSIVFDKEGNVIESASSPLALTMGYFSRGIDHLPSIYGDVLVKGISDFIYTATSLGPLMFDEGGITLFGLSVLTYIRLYTIINPAAIIEATGTLVLAIATMSILTIAEFRYLAFREILTKKLLPLASMMLDAVATEFTRRLDALKDGFVWTIETTERVMAYMHDRVDGFVSWLDSVGQDLLYPPHKASASKVRDFSQSKLKELLRIAQEVQGEQSFDITKWDVWYRVETTAHSLLPAVLGDLSRVQDYQRKVIDINDMSIRQICEIFDTAHEVDAEHARMMRNLVADIESVGAGFGRLAASITFG